MGNLGGFGGANWLKWVSLTIFLLVSLFNHILSHFGTIFGRFLVDFGPQHG